MDEGRRMCLIFPTLVDLSWSTSENDGETRRRLFEPRYALMPVHIYVINEGQSSMTKSMT